MPDEAFKVAYLKANPDMRCVQAGCDVNISSFVTASYNYGFGVTHNGVSSTVLGMGGPDEAMEKIRLELGKVLHRGEHPPYDPLLIVRG